MNILKIFQIGSKYMVPYLEILGWIWSELNLRIHVYVYILLFVYYSVFLYLLAVLALIMFIGWTMRFDHENNGNWYSMKNSFKVLKCNLQYK